jgi:hypothetical protein
MNIEGNNADNELIEPVPDKKSNKRKYVLIGAGLLVVSCLCLLATGVLNINTDFYAGGYSVEKVVVTDELGSDGRPASQESKTVFSPTGRIDTAVYTSGIDATVGMRWYHEDTLLFEMFERTRDNYLATYLEGAPYQPLPSGQYRVEIHIGRNSPPVETVYFVVEELDLEVIPPMPTPQGHIDIENAPYLEVPIAFDEVWEIDDDTWNVNEVKITFFEDSVLFVIVIDSDIGIDELSEAEARQLSKPIAQYALQNGYYEAAKAVEINGIQYEFDNFTDPIVVTFFNKSEERGYRTRFNIDDLTDEQI